MPPKRKADGGAAGGPASSKKGKAPKDASPALSGAAASQVSIPVDGVLADSGQLPGACVWRDYAYLGNQVDIGNNNNKFYRGQVLTIGNSYYSWTRWGRVGENGQSALAGPMNEAEAVKAFEGKFKDKTGHKWNGREASYPAPGKKKYTVIYEALKDTGQSAKLEAAQGGGVKYADPKVKGSLADFVRLITDNDMFEGQLSELGVDTSKMPLGDIQQRTIDAGFEALHELEEYLKAGGGPRHAELCSKFYTYIPHAVGRQKAPLIHLDGIQSKRDMLNVISDVGAAVSSQKKVKNKKKGALEQAPIDAAYESVGALLQPISEGSDELKMIRTFTENTAGYRKMKVESAFKVERHTELKDNFEQHKDLKERKLLWHGTNLAVVAAILKSGLRIMPHSGGRVGAGIYLASEHGKSAGYTHGNGRHAVMFLCEAALGQAFEINADGVIGWRDNDPLKSKKGMSSVLAVGSTEPDPKADIKVKLDKRDVVVPLGKPIANSKLKDHGGHSSFSQSEYLLYKESQCRIRYVLKMELL